MSKHSHRTGDGPGIDRLGTELWCKIAATTPAILLTILSWDPQQGTLTRIYSSDPAFNPVGGTKKLEVSQSWTDTCIDQGRRFVAPTLTELQSAFTDWKAIQQYGGGAIVNLPLVAENSTVAVVNILGPSGSLTEDDIERADHLVSNVADELVRYIINSTPIAGGH
ncbi:GAF domain-containing protein [Rhodococcus sp. NPDC057529]|uniref:GAF domain-containing protein n=1 Tax=Rhodococcus sp. NPDC057529 TaxID=3346158 RepID=UPI00366C96C1